MLYSITLNILIFIIGFVFTKANCPPKEEDMKFITKYLKAKLDQMKKYKPGTDTRDADWAIEKVGKEVLHSKKYAPCNQGFNWPDIHQDANMVRKECYKPADFSTEPVQNAFKACVLKFAPSLIMKYGTPALDACSCFTSTIVPAWESKYKKYVGAYIEEFKTLKHRKK